MLKEKGQSTLEFTILAVCIIGALLTTQVYIKRGIQGRWKAAIDDIGDQYDPRISDTMINRTVESNSLTNIFVEQVDGGNATMRRDTVSAVEKTSGSIVTSGEQF